MRSKTAILTLALLGAALACNTPGAQITAPVAETPEVYVVTATPLPATSGPPPTATAALPPTSPPSVGPKFGPEIKFATTNDPAAATRTFKTGTKRIYGMWTYSGMTSGLTIRREWYHNNTLWIKREEAWDFAKYGASGTVTDISIYDEEYGLPDGQWEVRLFIDDKAQFAGDSDFNFRSFVIGTPGGDGPGLGPQSGVLSPDGKLVAAVEPVYRITISDGGGTWRTLVSAHWIAGFDWLPDSKHIVYSDKTDDGSSSPLGVSYDLYVVDVDTGDSKQLNNDGEDLHDPVVSPDGKHIGLVSGSGYGDACAVARGVAIMEFDSAALTRVSLARMSDFKGLEPPEIGAQLYAVDAPDFSLPGVWQGANQFKTAVRFTCVEGGAAEDGVYTLDVLNKVATKTGGLPEAQ